MQYVNHAFAGAEVNCPLIEKFAHALVMASRNRGSQDSSLNGSTLEERPPKVRRLKVALEMGHQTLLL